VACGFPAAVARPIFGREGGRRAGAHRHREAALDGFDYTVLHDEYRDESQQQLAQLDAALLRIEESGDLPEEERLALLRALHTLKGNSGMLGLQPVVRAIHRLEAALRDPAARWDRERVDFSFEVAAAVRRVVARLGSDGQEEALAHLAALRPPWEGGPQPVQRNVEASPARTPGDGPISHEPPASPLTARPASAPPEKPDDEGADGSDGTGEILRVPFAKLDDLLNRVGELLTAGAALEDFLERHDAQLDSAGLRRTLEERVESLALVSDSIRYATMELRLVPVARLFQRFPRLARDLAHRQGKRIRIETVGDEVELDKSTVDALVDPLLHLVRNAVDHGIGTPAERAARGKPEVGTVTLSARRTGDRVVVEVRDDGEGLDRDAILARARAEGLALEAGLDEPGSLESLIFRSGFSTREEATEVSGRGVGLDVVHRRVIALRGSLSVSSEPGRGTHFALSLPLTLAIVPALLFEAEGEVLAVPSAEVQETLRRVRPERAAGAEVVRLRDTLIPVARPGRLLGWPEPAAEERAESGFAIVVTRGTRSAALLADRIVDQRDVVLKPLPRTLGVVPAVSGATVTPAGQVVLLLDTAGLLDLNLNLHRRENRAG
jgi:two-component system, chemotaxis family, sensor kinase CheA